ncbi:hypothetical protein [Hymenobacter negativus]|uniref:Uncharacterized protein n=1 Tax=Hymenobacter negativus TaxID=2795026 RepID=A0ABS3QEK5_9BACT|nr:hypothetical protein [Hymenobacter negativus]MBO2009607.1 hypothetical protein [Hymenobacter negativus]
MKEQLNLLKSSIGKTLLSLKCDDIILQIKSGQQIDCENACIYIESLGCIEIGFDEGSHFYGESDLILNYSDSESDGIQMSELGEISSIIYWIFTPIGFNLFPAKYLVHIELLTDINPISIGFIKKTQEGSLVIDISSIHISTGLIEGNSNNLEKKKLN